MPLAPEKMPVPLTITSVSVPLSGSGGVRVAGARALAVAERLVQDERSADDADGAQVASAITASAERDRLGRVTVRDEGACPAEAAVWEAEGRAAAVDVLDDRLGERHFTEVLVLAIADEEKAINAAASAAAGAASFHIGFS